MTTSCTPVVKEETLQGNYLIKRYHYSNRITNKEKLTMSTKEGNGSKESKEPDYDEDKDQLEEKQEEETGETTNQVF